MDHILKAFLEEARNGAQPSAGVTPIQIVSLGAGFDTLYFRLHEAGLLGPQDVIYEVDLPKVAQKKATTIQQTPELSSRLDPPLNAVPDSAALAEAMRIHEESRQKRRKAKAAAAAAAAAKGLPPPVSSGTSHGASMGGSNASPAAWPQALGGGLYTQRYRLVGVDLCQTALTSARLRAAGVQPDLPTLVLTECVLTYLGPHPADAILGWVASYFDHVAVALYEQIIPSDAFGTFMQGHFLRQSELAERWGGSGERETDKTNRGSISCSFSLSIPLSTQIRRSSAFARIRRCATRAAACVVLALPLARRSP